MTGPGDPTVAATPGSSGPSAGPPAGARGAPGTVPVGAAGPTAGGETGPDRASLGDLIGSVTQDLSMLVRQEMELARAELTQSAKRAGRGSGLLAGAGVAAHLVLVFLSVALWWALPLGRAWSALIVAGVWVVIAAVLALRGRGELRRVQGLPRTAESVKKIPNALRGDEEASHE